MIATAKKLCQRAADLLGRTGRKGIVALADQAVVSGASFLTTVIVGRVCGADDLGLYALAFTALVFIAAVQESLLWTPYTVFLHRQQDAERSTYTERVFVLQLATTALLLLVLIGVVGAIALGSSAFGVGMHGLAAMGLALGITLPLFLLREFARRVLLAQLSVISTLWMDAAVAVIHFASLAVIYWYGLLSAATACACFGIACGIVGVAWVAIYRPGDPRRVGLQAVREDAERHWQFGRWICAGQLSDVVQNYSMHWLLVFAVGAAATGTYAACWSLVLVFNPLILGIGSVLVPRAAQVRAERGIPGVRDVVWKTTVVLGLVMIVLCAGLTLLSGFAMSTVYGASYQSSWHVLAVLAWSMCVAAISFPADNGLWVIDRPDLNFKAAVAGLVTTLAAAVLLVPTLGILGAAVASLAGVTLTTVLQCMFFFRLTALCDPVTKDSWSNAGAVEATG